MLTFINYLQSGRTARKKLHPRYNFASSSPNPVLGCLDHLLVQKHSIKHLGFILARLQLVMHSLEPIIQPTVLQAKLIRVPKPTLALAGLIELLRPSLVGVVANLPL